MKSLAAVLYAAAVGVRNAAYDRGLLHAASVERPVVSVGNITAGGTGKTPVVEFLIRHYLAQGKRPAVVSRGYGRDTAGELVVSDGAGMLCDVRSSGDEPAQIARKFPSVPVLVNEKRADGCRSAVRLFSPDVLLLDDAFQHRAVARDLDIVVVDALAGMEELRLLPAGRLREPLRNLARAGLILLSRCSEHDSHADILSLVRAHSDAPVLRSRFRVRALQERSGGAAAAEDLQGKRVLAFCGIGSPASFHRTLLELGINPLRLERFPDHHWYSETDVLRLVRLQRELGAEICVTTEKDATRLRDMDGAAEIDGLCWPLLELELLEGEETVTAALDRAAVRMS